MMPGMKRTLICGVVAMALIAFTSSFAPAAEEPATQPGENVHDPTGWAFPESVGPFRDRRITRYDDAGANMSAGYGVRTPELQIDLNPRTTDIRN